LEGKAFGFFSRGRIENLLGPEMLPAPGQNMKCEPIVWLNTVERRCILLWLYIRLTASYLLPASHYSRILSKEFAKRKLVIFKLSVNCAKFSGKGKKK
jgi:hypothetical protein